MEMEKPADPGIRLILEEIRDLRREAAEDRRRSEEDRRRSEEDRRRSEEDRKRSDGRFEEIVARFARSDQRAEEDREDFRRIVARGLTRLRSIDASLHAIRKGQDDMRLEARRGRVEHSRFLLEHGRILHEIARLLRIRGNGRPNGKGGNGR